VTFTDLDLLHATVAADRPRARGSGKTFAQCHALAAAVEFGEPLVLCRIPARRWLLRLRPMIRSVFADHDLPFLARTSTEFLSRCGTSWTRIVFMGRNNPARGWGHDYAEVNFDDTKE